MAELLLGGLMQPRDTRDTEQGPGVVAVCKPGRESSAAPKSRWVPLVMVAGRGAHHPGRNGKHPRKAMLELREEQHQQKCSMPGEPELQRGGGGGKGGGGEEGGGSHAKAISLDRKGSSKLSLSLFPGSPRGKELGAGMWA